MKFIRIEERVAEPLREQPADGRLAAAASAGQAYEFTRAHVEIDRSQRLHGLALTRVDLAHTAQLQCDTCAGIAVLHGHASFVPLVLHY